MCQILDISVHCVDLFPERSDFLEHTNRGQFINNPPNNRLYVAQCAAYCLLGSIAFVSLNACPFFDELVE